MNLSPTAVRDLDKYKRNYQTLLGIALTEAGALYAPKLRITLPYIARFALVGGGLFSSLLFSYRYLLHNKTELGLKLGIAGSVATVPAVMYFNYPTLSKVLVTLGCMVVFTSHVNRLRRIKAGKEELREPNRVITWHHY